MQCSSDEKNVWRSASSLIPSKYVRVKRVAESFTKDILMRQVLKGISNKERVLSTICGHVQHDQCQQGGQRKWKKEQRLGQQSIVERKK